MRRKPMKARISLIGGLLMTLALLAGLPGSVAAQVQGSWTTYGYYPGTNYAPSGASAYYSSPYYSPYSTTYYAPRTVFDSYYYGLTAGYSYVAPRTVVPVVPQAVVRQT